MARNSVYQQLTCFTVPRENFLNMVVYNENLSKKDLRVLMLLLTKLEGINPNQETYKDRDNYIKISPGNIAKDLGLSKREVLNAIDNLLDEDIIQEGSSKTVKCGYRFTF